MLRWRSKPSVSPDWMIVGLGNPGGEYRGTRHNVGFEVVELLSRRWKIKLNKGRHGALTGQGKVGGVPAILVKPLSYMNLSGQSVGALARQLGLAPTAILVVADDMDLEVGRLRLKPKGGPGGHNGHKSIIQALGSQDYPRLKVGIGAAPSDRVDHVLGGFSPSERDAIDRAIEKAADGCEAVVAHGVDRALNIVNEPRANGPESAEE